MKTSTKVLGLALLAFSLLFSSCEGDKPSPKPEPEIKEIKTIEYLNASAHDKWVYFNFAEGKVVEVTDEAADLKWDVAFKRQNIKVNSPVGYSGKAAVAKAGTEDFSKEVTADGKSFVQNVMAPISVSFAHGKGMAGFKLGEVAHVTDAEDDYYNVEEDGRTIGKCHYKNTYTTFMVNMEAHGQAGKMFPIRNDVFIFRSADGKKAYKLKMKGSYDATGEKGGYLSFDYQQL